ncbi:MAG: molybdopterin dinucleotide binding domain-containing protein, partial [Polyangiaceae bacterium]
LVKGKTRHELLVHPADLASRGIADGDRVRVQSRVGDVVVEARASDEMMPGVVSLPHGFGHKGVGLKLTVAEAQPGVSANDLTDGSELDVSGNAVVNGVPVEIHQESSALRPTAVTTESLCAAPKVERRSDRGS